MNAEQTPIPQAPQQGKSFVVVLILAILLPGIDRMYAGHIGLGILKFITCGGVWIWWIIDIVLILTGKYMDGNGNPLVK
jgi:TM2 domain-containing membrane protein YozV